MKDDTVNLCLAKAGSDDNPETVVSCTSENPACNCITGECEAEGSCSDEAPGTSPPNESTPDPSGSVGESLAAAAVVAILSA